MYYLLPAREFFLATVVLGLLLEGSAPASPAQAQMPVKLLCDNALS
uniref:Uncharacterized protein n=1 Tax=Anguilla anguilla TaxID=7936 RepID=A0A0E9RGQ1_ANGAN